MQFLFALALLAGVAVTTACVIPPGALSNTITNGFGILIQNPQFPVIHDRYMNLDPAGGGDQHLFLNPVGDPTFNLVLSHGILEQDIIHAVIDGEYSAVDNTTKMFMTNRGDPKAIFQPVYGCDPDTDQLQIQLAFQTRETSPVGGLICVRVASGNRGYEFRYSPPANPAFDPTNPCMPVTMVVVSGSSSSASGSSSSTSSQTPTSTMSTTSVSATTTTTTSSSTTKTSTSSSSTPISSSTRTTTSSSTKTSSSSTTSKPPSSTPLPYTDMTAKGFAFVGCAPEERRATDGPGRTLTGSLYADDAMTDDKCMAFCASEGYSFAGTEYTRECWCGNSVAPGRQPQTTIASLAACNMPCGGDTTQYCGGDAWLSLYKACTVGSSCVNAQFT